MPAAGGRATVARQAGSAEKVRAMSNARQAAAALSNIRDRLERQPSIATRAETAAEVGSLLSSGTLSKTESQSALAILEQLIRDTEQQVREALALHVRTCAILPPSLARTIAEDIETISIPFIRMSPSLLDADLLAIIASGITAKQVAVAKRDRVTERVSDALVATKRRRVVTSLLENPGAAVSEPSYQNIIDDFHDDAGVQDLLVERPVLPLSITERLIQVVSESLRQRLVEKHNLPEDLVTTLLDLAGESVLMQGTLAPPRSIETETLAARLAAHGRLTPTLLMRALCLGDQKFFEAGMAVLARVPVANAAALVADRGPLGFKCLYEQSGLPAEYFRAFRTTLDVLAELRATGDDVWSPLLLQQIHARVMREYDEACPADLNYFLGQMAHRLLGRTSSRTRW
jgi:uncharacterized protein (DUF2336 family)